PGDLRRAALRAGAPFPIDCTSADRRGVIRCGRAQSAPGGACYDGLAGNGPESREDSVFERLPMDLQGKVALVTGSSRGLGRATALELARRGAHVAVNYLHSKELAEEVTAEIERTGRQALCLRADVADLSQVQEMIGEVFRKWGRVDILVNNAG